jgi:hypothetical protein
MNSAAKDELAARFRHFAEQECQDSSPLYAVLALTVAQDSGLLELAGKCQAGQPPPNLLFAAVHDLLLRGHDHPLRGFYPEFGVPVQPAVASGPVFRDFCLRWTDKIADLLRTRLVQTNEVRRSVYLQAAFAHVVRQLGQSPLVLIEVGPSAGFNLCWDRCSYGPDAGALHDAGQTAPVLTSEWCGAGRPPAWASKPTVVHRCGVDLNLINLDDEKERCWLLALIWPEHAERRERLVQAMEITRRETLRLMQGNAEELLPELIAIAPTASLPCIYHTHVANQMAPGQKERLLRAVNDAGCKRDLCHVHNDIERHLHLTIFQAGRRHDMPLAKVDGHARWVEWMAV